MGHRWARMSNASSLLSSSVFIGAPSVANLFLMGAAETSDAGPVRKGVPRRVVLVLSPLVWLVAIPVAVAVLVLVWLHVVGYAQRDQLPERVELNWDPKMLMTGGPYAYSRHPM